MIATAKVTPAARNDLAQIADHIAADNPDAAHRILRAAEQCFSLLASNPELGVKYSHTSIEGLRVITLGRRFRNYVVFYLPVNDGVEVVRVLHGSRDINEVIRAHSD